MLLTKLFPTLLTHRFAEVDLNVEAQAWLAEHAASLTQYKSNPLLSTDVCRRFIEDLHQSKNVECSFGGYLEDRSALLKDSYLASTGQFLHLGVDLNVPGGSEVASPLGGEVLRADNDHDRDGGWGPRVLIACSTPLGEVVVVFSHLMYVRVRAGQQIAPGTIIGRVGNPPRNGNWWPHLHVQCVTTSYFSESFDRGLQELDGYGHISKAEELAVTFPDPMLTVLDNCVTAAPNAVAIQSCDKSTE